MVASHDSSERLRYEQAPDLFCLRRSKKRWRRRLRCFRVRSEADKQEEIREENVWNVGEGPVRSWVGSPGMIDVDGATGRLFGGEEAD